MLNYVEYPVGYSKLKNGGEKTSNMKFSIINQIFTNKYFQINLKLCKKKKLTLWQTFQKQMLISQPDIKVPIHIRTEVKL